MTQTPEERMKIPTITDYHNTIPSGLDHHKTDWTGACFDKADLTDQDMSECNLTRATFRRAILVRVNLSNCFIDPSEEGTIEEQLKQAQVIQDVILPDGSLLTWRHP